MSTSDLNLSIIVPVSQTINVGEIQVVTRINIKNDHQKVLDKLQIENDISTEHSYIIHALGATHTHFELKMSYE